VQGTRDQHVIDIVDTVVDAEHAAEVRHTSIPRTAGPGSPGPARRRVW
jgi:hypothetical protein